MRTHGSASGRRFWLRVVGVSACLSIGGCSSSGSPGDRGAGDAPGGNVGKLGHSRRQWRLHLSRNNDDRSDDDRHAGPERHNTYPRAIRGLARALGRILVRTGVHVVTTPTGSAGQSGSSSGAGAKITSDNPKCAPFVAEANTAGNAGIPGVTGYDNRTFQADGEPGPFLIEEITTVGTAEHVANVLASLNDSIHGCTKLTMSIPGANRAP